MSKYTKGVGREGWDDWLLDALQTKIAEECNGDEEDVVPRNNTNKVPTVTQPMAERIMDALCEDGRGDFLLLKDDEIREWWQAVTKRRTAEAKKRAAAERRIRVREEALKKLTAEERKVLGL